MRRIPAIRNIIVIGAAVFVFSGPVLAFNVDGSDSTVDSAQSQAAQPGAYPTVKSLGTIRMDEMQNPAQPPMQPPMAGMPVQQPSPLPQPSAMPPTMPMTPGAMSMDDGPAPATPDLSMKVFRAGDATYITGGIGDEERDALDTMKPNYNLHIMSASQDGAFLGDVRIAIRDSKGSELINATAGPIFYASLPAGHYEIEANSSHGTMKRNVTVSKSKASNVHLTWP